MRRWRSWCSTTPASGGRFSGSAAGPRSSFGTRWAARTPRPSGERPESVQYPRRLLGVLHNPPLGPGASFPLGPRHRMQAFVCGSSPAASLPLPSWLVMWGERVLPASVFPTALLRPEGAAPARLGGGAALGKWPFPFLLRTRLPPGGQPGPCRALLSCLLPALGKVRVRVVGGENCDRLGWTAACAPEVFVGLSGSLPAVSGSVPPSPGQAVTPSLTCAPTPCPWSGGTMGTCLARRLRSCCWKRGVRAASWCGRVRASLGTLCFRCSQSSRTRRTTDHRSPTL